MSWDAASFKALNADEFVAALLCLAPSDEESQSRGLDAEERALITKRLSCPAREGRRARASVLEDLLQRYDCSALQLGRVTFVSDPRPHWAGMVVAFFEAQPVVLVRCGEVALFELERFGERLMECAPSGGQFLAALLGFAHALRRGPWSARDLDQTAQRCAELAGGLMYEPFYTAVCSILEYGQPE